MRAAKRRRDSDETYQSPSDILTPGAVITHNPQWMRYVLALITPAVFKNAC